MKHLHHKLTILFLALSFTSCATVNWYESGSDPQLDSPREEQWTHLFLGYSVGNSNVRTTCPAGQEVVQFQTKLTPGQWLISVFTGSLYSPITAKYWCG